MNIIEAMTGVFDSIGDWFVDAVSDVTSLFYVSETGLTLLGTLAVIGLSISIVMLLLNLVKSFLRLH